MRAVAVLVVSYNSSAVLADCLASVTAAAAGRGTATVSDVVVVDNDSQDDSVSIADGVAGVRVLKSGRNAGYAAAINLGVDDIMEREAGTDAVLILNPDTRLRAGALDALLAGLDEPGTGITVPRLVHPDGRIQYSLRRRPSLPTAVGEAVLGGLRAGRFSEIVTEPARYESAAPTDWATGAVMLVSSRTVRTVGAWDETFFLYSEETEYCLRAERSGLATRFVPTAVVEHGGGASGTDPWLWSLLVVNRVVLYRRLHGAVAGSLYALVTFLGQLVRAAGGRRTSRAAVRALLRPHSVRGPR